MTPVRGCSEEIKGMIRLDIVKCSQCKRVFSSEVKVCECGGKFVVVYERKQPTGNFSKTLYTMTGLK